MLGFMYFLKRVADYELAHVYGVSEYVGVSVKHVMGGKMPYGAS
jgi:hypothetical protein